MKERITSVIGESLLLELLTHRPLSAAQVAEIQVLLASKSVARFAFAFCHLVHWVAFGQTQPDAAEDTETLECDPQKAGVESSSPSDCAHGGVEFVSAADIKKPHDLARGSSAGLRQKKDGLDENQEVREEEVQAVNAVAKTHPVAKLNTENPNYIFREELLRLRGGSANLSSLFGGGFTAADRRYGVLQQASGVALTSESNNLEEYEDLQIPLNTCRRRLRALAAAEIAYRDVMEKIKVCFAVLYSSVYCQQATNANFGAFGISLICPLSVLAVKDAIAWALRQQLPKLLGQKQLQLELADRINSLFAQLFDQQGYFSRFPAIDAHPHTQQLQKRLEKYQANCPKPPVSAIECFQTLCSPLDLTQCTEKLELQVKELQDEVYKQPSILQLFREDLSMPRQQHTGDEDPQHKLLRLQKEQQELLSTRDPKVFEPITNWNCPGETFRSSTQVVNTGACDSGAFQRLPQEPQRQSVGPKSTMYNKISSTSRVMLCEMLGSLTHTDPRVRMLAQKDRKHHYMYSELRGPRMVPRCASGTHISFAAMNKAKDKKSRGVKLRSSFQKEKSMNRAVSKEHCSEDVLHAARETSGHQANCLDGDGTQLVGIG
ncbi:hypothetical protein, conserved [Eimeria necatrix]|uniref:Uncharacterized protein n=1 Tax=Eimeria necatrix TaxID=51315 RepID=U6MP87_9EIME|nr:hypothetical protein, conserved [Eimeria necatrix]CDJ64888.1 hypothetical protein, conserved [Eimeria necatrix]